MMPLKWRSRLRFDRNEAGERALAGQNWTLDGNPGIVSNLAMDHEMRLNSNHGQILSPRTDPIRQPK